MTGELGMGPRLTRHNLKQEAAQHIRDLIFSGALHPGERLDQDRLADQLGVSKLPIREALITLEAEGMVTNIARRGSFVARLEPEDIVDHFEMYGSISGMAASRVAHGADRTALVAELRQVAAQMRDTPDSETHDRLNFRFHRIINKAGGSRRLISVLRILSDNMPSQFFTSNHEWEFRDRAFAEHDAIVDAIEAGDGERASAALVEHFAHTGEQAVRMLRSVGFWAENPAEAVC